MSSCFRRTRRAMYTFIVLGLLTLTASALAVDQGLPALPPTYDPAPLLARPMEQAEVDPVQAMINQRIWEIDQEIADLNRKSAGSPPINPQEIDPGPIPERESRDAAWLALQESIRRSAQERPSVVVDVIAQPPPEVAERLVREINVRNRLGLTLAWQGILRTERNDVQLAQQALTILDACEADDVPADEQVRWRYLRAWFHAQLWRLGPAEEKTFHQAQVQGLANQLQSRDQENPLTLTVLELATELQ